MDDDAFQLPEARKLARRFALLYTLSSGSFHLATGSLATGTITSTVEFSQSENELSMR